MRPRSRLPQATSDELCRETDRVSSTAVRRLSRAGRAAEGCVLEGDAAGVIVEMARRRGSDVIVVGTRGRTGVERLALGSVAHSVLMHAPCSVLVARGLPVRRAEPAVLAVPAGAA